jgi:hypothetical protein
MKVVPTFQKIHRCEFIGIFDVGFGFAGARQCKKLGNEAYLFLRIERCLNFTRSHSNLILELGKQTGNTIYYGVWNHRDYED